nr:cyclin-u4-1 [Quercus suber]
MVAAKFMDDIYYNNAYYAKVGGISTIEMNFLEVDFLFGLGFRLNVTPNTFHIYCSYLQREMMMQQPPLNLAESSINLGKSLKLHLCFNEDEPSHQQQQLAV